jgi:hypothetical protein
MRRCTKKRGSSLVEVMTGAGLMMLVTLGAVGLLVGGLQSFSRTSSDLTMTYDNSQGLRRIGENLREGINVTISESGSKIVFNKPAFSGSVDSITGEKEYIYPFTSDGVTRGYQVNFTNGTVTDLQSGKVIVSNIASKDPDKNSSSYNQSYTPFTLTTVGSRKAIVMNLICSEKVGGSTRYQRMKVTYVMRNQ